MSMDDLGWPDDARRAVDATPPKRWWRYAVLRGDGIPASLDGMWFDLDSMPDLDLLSRPELSGYRATIEGTNKWEQRSDGAVAVVYEWVRREP